MTDTVTLPRATVQQAIDACTPAMTGWHSLAPLSVIAAAMESLDALRSALDQPDQGGKTGWPPGLLQDDCRGLSKWLASQPDARRRVREAVAALEQPEQAEPVACFREWRTVLRKLTFMARTSGGTAGHDSGLSKACDEAEALLCKPYTYTQPPRREWRGLTEDEIRPLSTNCYDGTLTDPLILFARAIEAALRSKNHD